MILFGVGNPEISWILALLLVVFIGFMNLCLDPLPIVVYEHLLVWISMLFGLCWMQSWGIMI